MRAQLEWIRRELQGERLSQTAFARELRQSATDAEARMWTLLRNRRMNGRKFRRQHPVGPYILDFFCAELNLAVELDGGQHNSPEGKVLDRKRTVFLNKLGIRVLRFMNREVLVETERVLDVIWRETAKP